MDQVRKILTWIKQQHFWLLCGIAAIVALVCWNSARGKLAKEFEANKAAIKTEIDSEKSLMGEAFHANYDINTRQQREIDEQIKSVEATWKQLHDRQRKEVLEWPAQLTKKFRDKVEKLKFGQEIPEDLRSTYRDYADRHFETMPKIVGARVMRPGEGGMGGGSAFGGRGGMFGGRGGIGLEGGGEFAQMQMTPEQLAEDQNDYLCEWLDQHVVRNALEFPQRPSSWRIWVTQEDLWVYETLLRIIARTNEAAGTDRMSNAAIRSIYSLEVGQAAGLNSRAKGRIEITLPQAAPSLGLGAEPIGGAGETSRAAPPMTMGEFGPNGPGMRGEMGMGNTPISPEQEKAMLLAGRYLDAAGKPIGGAASMAGGPGAASPDGTTAPAETLDDKTPFKRLPIRMVLHMDQRWIPHLIAECANQPLQVEVTEVRINAPDLVGQSGGGGGGEGFGRGGGMGGTGSTLKVHTPNQLQTFHAQPNLATVAIQGMIYIFQEPSKAILPPTEQVVTNPN